MKPCECGCGQLTRNTNRFVFGHHNYKEAPQKGNFCMCGCGKRVPHKFARGHANRVRRDAPEPTKKPKLEKGLCLCGCGTPVTQSYVNSSHKAAANKLLDRLPGTRFFQDKRGHWFFFGNPADNEAFSDPVYAYNAYVELRGKDRPKAMSQTCGKKACIRPDHHIIIQ